MSTMAISNSKVALCIGVLALSLWGSCCRREQRDFRATAEASQLAQSLPDSQLHPGGATNVAGPQNPFQGNAYAITEGQRLFTAYNCVGCHAHGGGGIGPALNDKVWIYGGQPGDIYESIARGRPNGMPAWGPRIPEYQIWQLTAYVQSLSEGEPSIASPARGDEISPSSVQPRGENNPK